MAERRGMGQALALTPEKMVFIQGGTGEAERPRVSTDGADPAASNGHPAEQVKSSPQPVASEDPDSSTTRPRRSRASAAVRTGSATPVEQEGFYGTLLVPLTTRLQPTTADALRRACLEQKLARRTPHSQQEIVELAVTQWLRDHRFL